jgi:hypothetical protein
MTEASKVLEMRMSVHALARRDPLRGVTQVRADVPRPAVSASVTISALWAGAVARLSIAPTLAYVLRLGGQGEAERRGCWTPSACPTRSRGWASTAPSSRRRCPASRGAAFADPSVRTNPRIPMVAELVELLKAGYAGW